MQKRTAIKIFILLAVIGVAIVGVFMFRSAKREQFAWDYQIVDDTRWKSTLDDGGTSTNVYYQINFEDRQVRKCEDKYSGPMQNYEYREKVIYQKEIDEKTATKFREVLGRIWQSGDTEEGTYDFYTIEHETDGARYIQSKSAIAQIQAYTDKINRMAESDDTEN